MANQNSNLKAEKIRITKEINELFPTKPKSNGKYLLFFLAAMLGGLVVAYDPSIIGQKLLRLDLVRFFGIVLVLLGLIGILIDILRDSNSFSLPRTRTLSERLEARLLMEFSVLSKGDGILSDIDELQFEKEIELYKEKWFESYVTDLETKFMFEDLYDLYDNMRKQIERLIGNSNLNLFIGIITAVFGLIILLYALYEHPDFSEMNSFLSFYMPRITTVVFVEIFSFFFLKLYKNNLSEIKYFQNEITNLHFKITALKGAVKMADTDVINKILSRFSETERNFILKKDETTEKIESLKIVDHGSSGFTKSLKDLVESIKN